jgi:predicted ATPase with chaperone activity
MKTCKCCGAVLSRSEVNFEDIIGQEHAKRALEVAIAGNHTIAFFGNNEAEALAEVAKGHNLTAWAMQTCPCGGFGFSPQIECTCSPSQISRWQKRKAYQNALNAEIVVECPPPYPDTVEKWLNGYRGEPESAVMARIGERGRRPNAKLDKSGRSLMKAAIYQLSMGPERVKSTIRVAQTIAALSRSSQIETYHLAEAIQYRPRRR